jgi:AraC family transcriptional activator of pobA
MTAVRALESQTPGSAGIDRQRERFTRLRQLIEDHYREHWPVGAYADALAISQARLNRMCKSFAGKSAGELVQDRLALEAQRHLIYTSASTAMIAYELGFQDPAYFSRFFKRRVGMAPGRFRAAKMAEPFPH